MLFHLHLLVNRRLLHFHEGLLRLFLQSFFSGVEPVDTRVSARDCFLATDAADVELEGVPNVADLLLNEEHLEALVDQLEAGLGVQVVDLVGEVYKCEIFNTLGSHLQAQV